MQPKSQPPLTRANAPTAFALRNIADRKARGRLRAAATAEAVGKGELEWLDAEGWRYQLEAPPRVTIAAKDNERAAATVDLKVWDATGTLIFRDRIHAWDGFPVLVPDGTQHEEDDGRGGKIRVSNFCESPLEAARLDLAHTVRVVTKNGPWLKATPGTVSTFYATTADAVLQSTGSTYAAARAGSGSLSVSSGSTTNYVMWTYDTSPTFAIMQLAFPFDTSAIGGDTVSAATLSLYQNSSINNIDNWGSVYIRGYDFGASITSADYRPTDGTSAGDTLLASLARASFNSNAYKDFTSEAAFPAYVNTSGETRLYALMSNTESATQPTQDDFGNAVQFRMADYTGTTSDPKLVVTHASATKPFRRALLGVGV